MDFIIQQKDPAALERVRCSTELCNSSAKQAHPGDHQNAPACARLPSKRLASGDRLRRTGVSRFLLLSSSGDESELHVLSEASPAFLALALNSSFRYANGPPKSLVSILLPRLCAKYQSTHDGNDRRYYREMRM